MTFYCECVFFIKNYLQDVNTHTSVPDSIKIVPGQPISCSTLAVRGVTVLPRQVMGGTAVKKWHKRKNTAAEGERRMCLGRLCRYFLYW
jgi:hypothetical protein